MDPGMQRLDASSQDLRLTGVVGHLGDLEALGGQGRAGASAGQKGHAAIGQGLAPARSILACRKRSGWHAGSEQSPRWGPGLWSPWLLCQDRVGRPDPQPAFGHLLPREEGIAARRR